MLAALCVCLGLQGVPAQRSADAQPVPAHPRVTAPVAAPVTAPSDTLRTLLDRAIEPDPDQPFWGAVLVVWHGEVLLSRGYGTADLAGRPIDVHTLFDVGSVSKQFTAAAVLRLAAEFELRLSDRLDQHFPDVPESKRTITIQHLLDHRSGLVQTATSDDKSLAFVDTREGWERHLLSRPVVAAPGEQFSYCNYNYLLLALLIERASGQPFESFVRANVLAPAGMSRTRFVGECGGDEADQSIRRHRYRRPGPPPKACDWAWGYGYRGATGLLCSIDELMSWDRALSDDRVLDAASRSLCFGETDGSYASGWYVQRDGTGRIWHSHDGRTDGYRASISRCTDEQALIAVMTNEKFSARLVDLVLRSTLPQREPAPAASAGR